MTVVRFNRPSLMSKLANEAFHGNMFDSNLGSHKDCNNDEVKYKVTSEDTVVNIEFAIPGLSKSDIKIEINNDVLIVKTREREENDVRTGFSAYEFEKKFKISDIINKDEISAHSENGVLYVSLPKVDKAVKKQARSIEIV